MPIPRLVGELQRKLKLFEKFLLNRYNFCTMVSNESKTIQGFLQAKPDIYKGMTVNTQDMCLSDEEFEKNLSASVSEWIKAKKRGVWFKVNIENSSFIPILVKHGFCFHHAKATYAMLTRWLPGDEPNLLPQFPHTHIGVGGMVVNEQNQVLTIQEKYHQKPFWKLPGGYSNPGEDFGVTARREVFEETGIETEFVSIVTFRQLHTHIFHCSDIYVVCHLQPLSSEITKSNEEISVCQWMNIDDYLSHPDVSDFNRFVMISFLENRKLKRAIVCSPVLAFTKEQYHKVYHIENIKDTKN